MTPAAGAFAFAPGRSWLHRMSPVPKLAWLAATVAFALATYHPVPLLAVAVAGVAGAVSAGAGRPVLHAMAVLAPLAASIIVLQALAPAACRPTCTTVAWLGPFAITGEGLARGISLVARVLAMECVAVAVLVTTHPADLFAGLRRIRVPSTFAFLLAMTMQLVPVLQRELGLVLEAQRARGLRAAGFRALVPALVPVFVAGFERIGRLAISMEARGFGAGVARTSWRQVAFTASDRVIAVAGVVAGVAGAAAGLAWWGTSSVPVLAPPAWLAVLLVGGAAISFAGVLVAAAVALGRD
jgi:energy-coupling factor transport system permease protein